MKIFVSSGTCAFALSLFPLLGCSDLSGIGGVGDGGTGGDGDLCEMAPCDDQNQCTEDACDPVDGACTNRRVANGTACADGAGECADGNCVAEFPATEEGVQRAAVTGGGPHTFAGGEATIFTKSAIVIDKNVVLDGGGMLTIDGSEAEYAEPILWIREGVVVEIRGVKITGGSGKWLAAVYNGGTLTLIDSTVSDNEVHGGAIGGGILNDGVMALVNSTVSGNQANENEDYPECERQCPDDFFFDFCFLCQHVPGLGGGIYNNGELTLTNSTVSGNIAHDRGGGIYNAGSLTLVNSTISGNTAQHGGALIGTSDRLMIINTIIHGDCELAGGSDTVAGTGNIESPGNSCGLDPERNMVGVSEEQLSLGPLEDNGGLTDTHVLEPGSMAINAIAEEDCMDAESIPLAEDQRGVPRPQDSACDVGAVEMVP